MLIVIDFHNLSQKDYPVKWDNVAHEISMTDLL